MLIKPNYELTIRLSIRILLTTLILLSVSAIVLFRERGFHYLTSLSMAHLLLLSAYALILLIYAVFVSELYVYWYDAGVKGKPYLWFISYMVLALIVIVPVNSLFIQILVQDQVPNILRYTTYWKREFPFFVLPLLLYILLVHWVPACRILWKNRVNKKEVQRRTYWDLWLNRGEPGFLYAYLLLKHGAPSDCGYRTVRIMDIMALLYEKESYFVVLWNGEKLLTHLTPKDIARWSVSGWFVLLKRSCYINMLYAELDPVPGDELRLHEKARAGWSRQGITMMEKTWGINRKCKKHVDAFLEDYRNWPIAGWEMTVELWPEEAK